MLYLILFAVPVVALLPMFVNKNHERSRGAVVISWVIVGLLCMVAANLVLLKFADQTKRNWVANCPPERVYHDSTFGNKCTSPIANPIEKAVVDIFGGPFSGILVMLIAIPLVGILSLVGFVKEFKGAKKRGQPVGKALWSTSFLVLISSTILILASFII